MTDNFHLHEYDSLRWEILEKTKQIDSLFRFMLAAVAASTTWILTNIDKLNDLGGAVVAWIPFLLSTALLAYRNDIGNSIRRIGAYLFTLEDQMARESEGWQHHIRPSNNGKSLNWFGSVKWVWRAVNGLTFAFGLTLTLHFLAFPAVDVKTLGDLVGLVHR